MLHVTKIRKTNHHKKAIIYWIIFSVVSLLAVSVSWASASDITSNTVVKLVNAARAKANVVMLKENELLREAAERKAQDMIDNNYFSHVSPQGKSPWDWIKESGYQYNYAGENLAIDFTNAKDEHEAWMESESHKKNILNSNYEDTGVAVKQGIINGHQTTVVVEMFGKQLQNSVSSLDVVNAKKVAGAETNTMQKISEEMNLNALFQNNTPTLIGWAIIFCIALIIIIVDVAAVFHRRHKPFFILQHETKTR